MYGDRETASPRSCPFSSIDTLGTSTNLHWLGEQMWGREQTHACHRNKQLENYTHTHTHIPAWFQREREKQNTIVRVFCWCLYVFGERELSLRNRCWTDPSHCVGGHPETSEMSLAETHHHVCQSVFQHQWTRGWNKGLVQAERRPRTKLCCHNIVWVTF